VWWLSEASSLSPDRTGAGESNPIRVPNPMEKHDRLVAGLPLLSPGIPARARVAT
jgi:hypothetical protein